MFDGCYCYAHFAAALCHTSVTFVFEPIDFINILIFIEKISECKNCAICLKASVDAALAEGSPICSQGYPQVLWVTGPASWAARVTAVCRENGVTAGVVTARIDALAVGVRSAVFRRDCAVLPASL